LLPRAERVRELSVIRIPWRGSRRYPIAPGVLRYIRGADIVHVHGLDFFFDFLAWTRQIHKRPLIGSTHGGFFHTAFAASLKQAYFNVVTPLSCRQYDAIVASSEEDAKLFEAAAGANLHLIENGVDIGKFWDCSSKQHQRTLIYFGRLAPHKRVPTLFTLLGELRLIKPDWRLIVAGREWGVSIDELCAAADTAGVLNAVEFPGQVTVKELRALIGRSSYFICASAYEGFGVAAAEALSAGLIPVLSTVSPFVKLLGRAGTGIAYDPERPLAAAERLNRFASSAANNIASLRRRAMETASAYDWTVVAEKFASLYRAVLAHRPRVGGNDLTSVRR
jgi:alpha-1,3-mannosyltransferase